MELFFDLFGFLDVVLRFIALFAQALEIGGIAFILLVVLPFRAEIGVEADEILRRCRRLLCWGAGAAALCALANIVINVLLLYGSADVPISEGLMANFAIAEMVRIAASVGVLILALDRTVGKGTRAGLVLLGFVLLAAAAASSTTARNTSPALVPLPALRFSASTNTPIEAATRTISAMAKLAIRPSRTGTSADP